MSKAEVIVAAATTGVFAVGDLHIQVVSVAQEGDVAVVFARAWRGDKQLGFGADGSVDVERFRFVNPPLNVLDGDVLVYNPTEALWQCLADTIRIVGQDGANIVPGKVGSTTTTIYPIAGDDSCYVVNASWATAHDAASGTLRGGGGTDGYNQANGSPFVVERYFATLDATSIPDTDVISSAVLSVYVNLISSGTQDHTTKVYNSSHSDTVAAGDFDLGGTTSWTDGGIVISTATLNAYNDMAFNATGIAGIQVVSGYTKLCLRDADFDVANVQPGTVDAPYLRWAKSNTTGTTQDPKLVVTHAAAPPATAIKDIIAAGIIAFPR